VIPAEKLDRLRQLAESATPGPWAKACAISSHAIVDREIIESMAACGPSHSEETEEQYAKVINDSEFIHAFNPTQCIELLDEIQRLTDDDDAEFKVITLSAEIGKLKRENEKLRKALGDALAAFDRADDDAVEAYLQEALK